MQARSAEKVKQVMDLMKMLHLKLEAKVRVNQQGFVEPTVFWTDDEKYPEAAPAIEEAPQAEAAPEAPAAPAEVAETM